jgi:hypothetical protein
MHVDNVREVPEYEIHPSELDFTNSVHLTKVLLTFFFLTRESIIHTQTKINYNRSEA